MNNRYIKEDNNNGVTYLRVCIKNALSQVKELHKIILYHIPASLLRECLSDDFKFKYRNNVCTYESEDTIVTVNILSGMCIIECKNNES